MNYNWYIIAIIAGVALIWIAYGVSKQLPHNERGRDKDRPKDIYPCDEQKQSLDYIYAKSNKSWVCKRCESINPNSTLRCVACGYQKEEKSAKRR